MRRKWRLVTELLESRLVPSTFNLHQGNILQQTVNIAQPGDIILLDAGATFMGTVTLKAKSNPQNLPITIATNLFPLSPGVRVGPGNAGSMAEVFAPGLNQPAFQTEPGANYYTLRGLNILPVNASALVDTLVTIGDGSSIQSSTSNLPNNIILDQCYIHGWDGQGIKRGVALNDGKTGSKTGVYNSYVSNFKVVGQDSQAIAGWNGTGPYTIQNNYLEAASENVLFGGAYSYIQQVPSNITIVNNLFSKPLSWNPTDPSYGGVHYSVKNLLELKNAQSVTIDSNTFQNNWGDAQDGHAILLTPRGLQSGGSWVTVSNVTFTHNTVQSVAQGFNILGSDDMSASQVTSNILIQDTVFSNIGYPTPGKNGQIFTLEPGKNGGSHNVVIDHDTITVAYTDVMASGVHTGFQFTNNLMPQGTYGMIVDGLGEGTIALGKAFPGGVITGNLVVGGQALLYPAGNYFPKTWDQVSQYPPAGARTVGVKAAATTTVSSSANPSVFGQSVTFTATVSGNGQGNPTGTVSFSDGSTSIGQGTLSSSNGVITATFSTSTLAAGAHTITASYSGDSTFSGGSAPLSGGQTVNPASTSLAVNSSADPSGFAQSVTFTATLSVQSPGAGSPTGTVQFRIDGNAAGNPVNVSSANGVITAAFTASSLGIGTHTVTASYSGTASFAGSTGTLPGGQTVNLFGATPTTTWVGSSANPSTLGQSVTFTATVKGNGGISNPTGTVTFLDGSVSIGQGALKGSGSAFTASFSTSSLTAANHTITASYSGDSAFASSTDTLTQTVNSSTAATTTAINSSVNPSDVGQAVTFMAMISSGSPGTPTGTVSFYDGSTFLDQETLSNGSNTVSFSASSLAAGTHTITATYSGDSAFATSTGTLTQTVNGSSTTTAISSSANPSDAGQAVTFTATVSSGTPGTPTGTVSFYDGATLLDQETLSNGANAVSFSTSSLAAGAHTITATYNGDSAFASSTDTLTQTVNGSSTAATTTAISSSANPSNVGQAVTFTATVSSGTPGTPTGTVSFYDGATLLDQETLSNGANAVSFSTSSLAAGTHTITATYSGDSAFATSTGTLTGGQEVDNPPPPVGNVAATLNFGTGMLTITGDTGANVITITQVTPGVLRVTGTGTMINQSSSPANFNFVTGITISLLNGKDNVTMNNFSISGNITITAGSGSDTFALTTVGANLIQLSGTGADSVSVNSVTARNDLKITVGAGSQSVVVKGTSCFDLIIKANSVAGDTVTFDLEKDTISNYGAGGLTLDDSHGAGNDTVTLSQIRVVSQLIVTLSHGTNTVHIDHVTASSGSINGGPSGNNHYFDNGGNFGFSVTGFIGH